MVSKTFDKGLNLIEALARSSRPLGVTELAAELDLAKSNAHRLLKTLERRGYVIRSDGDSRYRLSLRIWEIGSLVMSRLDLKRIARSHAETLAARTGETVHLSLLDGNEVVYIDKIDSNQPVRAYSRVGGRAPAHCVATGKVLIAGQSEDVIDSIAGRLEPYTDQTITCATEFHREIEKIKRQGYAINLGEWREDVRGLAAPIRDTHGMASAAIGISGPASRLTRKRLHELRVDVIAAAAAISGELGSSWVKEEQSWPVRMKWHPEPVGGPR